MKEGEDGAVVSESYTTPILLVLKEHPGWEEGQAGGSFSALDRHQVTERGAFRVNAGHCPGVAPSLTRVSGSEPTSLQEWSRAGETQSQPWEPPVREGRHSPAPIGLDGAWSKSLLSGAPSLRGDSSLSQEVRILESRVMMSRSDRFGFVGERALERVSPQRGGGGGHHEGGLQQPALPVSWPHLT